MARSAGSRPLRTLGVLVGLTLLLYGVIAAGVTWSNAQWTPKLALDLEGGTEIVLAPVPMAGATGKIDQNTIDRSVEIIRQRVNPSGTSEVEVTSQGQNIVVSIPGKPDPQTIRLVEQSAQLRFRAVLEAAAATPAATTTVTPTGTATSTPGASSTAKPSGTATASPKASTSTPATANPKPSASSNGMAVPQALLQATPSATATGSPSAASTGGSPVKATATPPVNPSAKPTDASDPNWANQRVGTAPGETYEQQFAALDCAKNNTGGGGDDPAKPLAACSKDGTAKYLLGPAEVVGTDVSSASATPEVNQQGNVTGTGWQVNLSFTGAGTKKFGDVTTRLAVLQGVRNQFAIVLDGLVISAPRTNQAIVGGQAQITGSFSESDATTLANQLKFGALPISFKTLTSQEISATLGSEQLRRGLLAGLIGLLLVVVYSLMQYRALGFLTIASLTIAGVLTYGFVVLLGWRMGFRLSLAGVAGLIVSIGITADSFIVFFERVRDEVRDGRNLIPAVESAWERARRTILASDAVSFLAAVVLFLLALGSVRGFAFTLGLTTVIDVLVVFMFTKPMVSLLARTKFFGGGHKLSGFDPVHLGRQVAYAGRGRVRGPIGTTGGTIAERRAAAARAAAEGSGEADPSGSGGELAGFKAGSATSTARPGASSGKES